MDDYLTEALRACRLGIVVMAHEHGSITVCGPNIVGAYKHLADAKATYLEQRTSLLQAEKETDNAE